MLSEETYALIQSKYCFKDLTSTLFGIPSGIKVYPEITESMIGSGKSGIKGLRKRVRELGYSEDNYELRSSLNEQKMIKLLDLLVKLCMVYTRTKKTEKAKIVFEKALKIMKELEKKLGKI